MTDFRADVDIDFSSRFEPNVVFPTWCRASLIKNEELSPHPCGYYPQNIPVDQVSNLAAIPYEEAEELGFFKLDFLVNHVYDHFESREEILELLNIEPDWSILLQREHFDNQKIFQLSKHYDLMLRLRPSSVQDVADAIALIRPGKSSVIQLYIAQKEIVRPLLYEQSEEYSFKKSHAIAYSLVIVLQLHLISLGLL